ncbi:biotin attachment protein [Pseudomonas sp. BN415]|uniref:lipoyl domain-containing protein n=1 Tax=Pseudomonas sp. BN415 TaxID=2567889 RepID=UPI002458C15B|nr:lipoyl domain-containing protein [Pseudomonas sp. BN415]MDH4580754.1 biotin attachment protein [Pseudomonas sp. BN415]
MITIELQEEAWDDVEDGTEALLDEWLVQPGSRVRAGDVIAIVVVAKTSFELVAPVDGVVCNLLVEFQDTIARGQALAELEPEA